MKGSNHWSSRQQPNATGWTAYDAHDVEQLRHPSNPTASWLAGFVPGSKQQSLPISYDEKRSSWTNPASPITPAMHRLTHLKKSLLRKIPSLEFLLLPRRSALTSSTPSPLSTISSAPAFPSGDTIRFILLCSLWYTSSALSSNTGKAILNQFRYPVTLTFVQFGFVAAYCLLFMSPIIGFSKLRRPTKAIFRSTFPMGCFQVGGHIFSSMAISRIPVSTVHTIKALSPLFTVATYALLFGVSYSPKTYLSLLPLTIGVMLACSFDMSASNVVGLLCAFGSAIVFVSSNIFFKKIMPSPGTGSSNISSQHKLDKLNLLFYSSGVAFLLMVPIWIYTDLPSLLPSSHDHSHSAAASHIGHPPHGSPSPHGYSTPVNFFLNGTVHFLQNVLAFVLLARTSPVTYSIASLIKRVAVICIAVVWFAQSVHPIQGLGIGLTFVGLWCYHGAKSDVEKGEKKVRRVENARDGMLPSTRGEVESDSEMMIERQERVQRQDVKVEVQSSGIPSTTAYTRPRANSTHPHLHSHPHPPLPPPPPSVRPPKNVHSTSPSSTSYTYSRTHPHVQPNLHIHISPHVPPSNPNAINNNTTIPNLAHTSAVITANEKCAPEGIITSPVDSYPSPPPSLDSPPGSSHELGQQERPWLVSSTTSTSTSTSSTGGGGTTKTRRGTITRHGGHGHSGMGVGVGGGGGGGVVRAGIVVA